MERIVTLPDGERKVFKGTVHDDAWEVHQRFVNGHRETSVRNLVTWQETDDPVPWTWEQYIAQFEGEELEKRLLQHEKEQAEKQRKNLEKSAQRAKSRCRLFIKAGALNELLTLTYRDNQEDRALCKKHFKEWVRRMKRALGGAFVYVASFERQERGAMHVHCACRKLPKHAVHKGVKIPAWKLGTAIWRDIVGPSEDGQTGGLCFVGGKTKRKRSIAKIATYVSKYILKDFLDVPLEKNRYSRSEGLAVPKAHRITLCNLSLREMVELVFECSDNEMVVSHRVTKDRWSGARYWLVTEPLDLGVVHD